MCFQKFPFAKNMEKVMVTPPVKSCKRVIKPRRQLYFPFGQTTQKSIFGSNLVGNLTKIKMRDSDESYTRIARNGEKMWVIEFFNTSIAIFFFQITLLNVHCTH